MSTDPDPSGGVPPPETLRIAAFGGIDVATALGDGGAGLAAAIARRGLDAPAIEVRSVPTTTLDQLLAAVDDWRSALDGVHVVVRSIAPDLSTDGTPGALGARFADAFARFVAVAKAAGTTVVAVNGSTVDPDDHVFSYQGAGCTPPLAVHQLDLELIRLSMLDGISVLDVDRIVAEKGGAATVAALFDYRRPVIEGILDELAMILEEYGWFDDRPILVQRGQRSAA
jgi:hypothetical protein